MKKILVISSSFRKGGNSDILADEFIRGAKESGNETEKIYLCDNDINYCRGCLVCQSTYKCVIKDDASAIAEKMKNADAIVFATPCVITGSADSSKQCLTVQIPYSRLITISAIYICWQRRRRMKKIHLILQSPELSGWMNIFEKSRLAGTVKGGGVNDKGEIKDKTEILKAAHEMGKSVK